MKVWRTDRAIGNYLGEAESVDNVNPREPKYSMACSVVHNAVLTRTYRGIAAVTVGVSVQSHRGARIALPDRSSADWANSDVDATPRLILSFWNSPCSRVLWRKIACLIGPSPDCIPFARSKSWTRTRARFNDVSFRSCFMRLDAFITSSRTGLSIDS